jgi:chemotaxis protein methyltransferase CheR
MVRWKRLNLLADLSAMGRFDVILLRGVLRNMDASLRSKVIQALVSLLPADGVLALDPEDDVSEFDDVLSAAPGGAGVYLRDPSVRVAAAA